MNPCRRVSARGRSACTSARTTRGSSELQHCLWNEAGRQSPKTGNPPPSLRRAAEGKIRFDSSMYDASMACRQLCLVLQASDGFIPTTSRNTAQDNYNAGSASSLPLPPLPLPSMSGAGSNGRWIGRPGSLGFWKICLAARLPDLAARLCQVSSKSRKNGGGATSSFSFPGNCR